MWLLSRVPLEEVRVADARLRLVTSPPVLKTLALSENVFPMRSVGKAGLPHPRQRGHHEQRPLRPKPPVWSVVVRLT